MEIFDVIDKDGNPTGETVTRERHMQKAFRTGQHIYGSFAKKKDAYRCCYRNGRRIKTLSRECLTLLQPDISRLVMNRSNLHSANSKKNSGFMQHRNSSTLLEPSRSPSRKNSTEKCSAMKNSHLCIFMISSGYHGADFTERRSRSRRMV